MTCSKFISFAEVVQGRDANVRVTDDGLLYAVELNMVLSGKDRNNAGRDLRDLSEDLFQSTKFVDRKMSGKGCGHTKLVSFKNAIELIMVLPGKVARETRKNFAGIIQRYLAGDTSLIREINENAESNAPIAQLARGSFASKDTEEDPESHRKRVKREDLELIKFEQDIKREGLELVRLEQDIKIQKLRECMDLMTTLRPGWMQADARLVLQTEDMIKNIMTQPAGLAITNGPSTDTAVSGSDGSGSISIGQIAQELGKRLTHGQSIQAGGLVARKYKERYDTYPPKHNQWVDGAERRVNSYTERDRGLIVEALKELGVV
jgi:hypothetical protein